MPGKFKAAYPYQEDVMSLPVTDLDIASAWYSQHFGMVEVERLSKPDPTVILERDGTKIGFAVNGNDPTQDGAAILVSDINSIKKEFVSHGINVGDLQTEERDGQTLSVFFVIAPDGLCFYIHEPVADGTANA